MNRTMLLDKLAEGTASELPSMTRREIRVPNIPNKALAVIGIRRSGKSTFLRQCLADRVTAGEPRSAQMYVNFEDDRLGQPHVGDLNELLEAYYQQYPAYRGMRRVGFFLDEIHLVPGWERFVRRVMDSEKADIFVSGSSAKLLSREVATALRGRAVEVLVHPFSFREALAHAGRLPAKAWRWSESRERSMLRGAFESYLDVGGFPEVQRLSAEDRAVVLRSYTDVAVLRDVIDRHQVSNVTVLRWLQRQLLGNAASKFSVEKFHAALRSQGMAVGKNTLHDYLGYIEDAFLVRLIGLDTASERQRMVNPRKAYPADPGFIRLFDRVGRTNRGHALETVVALELERRGASIAYVKTPGGFEVDFIARFHDGKSALIQVCDDAVEPEVYRRELRSLEDAGAIYPQAARWLLVGHDAGGLDAPRGTRVVNAMEWLLEP